MNLAKAGNKPDFELHINKVDEPNEIAYYILLNFYDYDLFKKFVELNEITNWKQLLLFVCTKEFHAKYYLIKDDLFDYILERCIPLTSDEYDILFDQVLYDDSKNYFLRQMMGNHQLKVNKEELIKNDCFINFKTLGLTDEVYDYEIKTKLLGNMDDPPVNPSNISIENIIKTGNINVLKKIKIEGKQMYTNILREYPHDEIIEYVNNKMNWDIPYNLRKIT
jgi:hypothetical protein